MELPPNTLSFISALAVFIVICAPAFAAYNPAALYCSDLGYTYETVDIGIGQQGICRFSSDYGDFCDAWEFYNGACAKDKGTESVKAQAMVDARKDSPLPTGNFLEPVLAQSGGGTGNCITACQLNIPSGTIALNLQCSGGLFSCSGQFTCNGQVCTCLSGTCSGGTGGTGTGNGNCITSCTGFSVSGTGITNLQCSGGLFSCSGQFTCNGVTCACLSGTCSVGGSASSGSSGLPSSFDWSNRNGVNYVTPSRDQKQLGTCWAFGIMSVMEAVNNKDNGNPQDDLSEQDLVSCGKAQVNADNYLSTNGITDEIHFPYSGSITPCSLKKAGFENANWRSSGWQTINNNEIKEALIKYGPLYASVSSEFYPYSPDPFNPRVSCTGTSADHGVLLIGYDDAKGVWLAKNNWGPGWANSGFFEITYGQCQVGTYIHAATGVIKRGQQSNSAAGCIPRISSADSVYITAVDVNGNRKTTDSPVPYMDLASPPLAHLELGKTYDFSVVAWNRANDKDVVYVNVWIDYGKDGFFSDSEKIFSGSNSFFGSYTFQQSFTVPSSAQKGDLRMRVYLSVGKPAGPCDSSKKGQVQDYTISTSDQYAECMPIDESKPLDRDLVSEGNCIKIQADNIVLDCGGHKISYGTKDGSSYGIYNEGHKGVTIKNCNIIQDGLAEDSHAIYFLSGADGATFENNNITVRGDNSHGIYLSDSRNANIRRNKILLEGRAGEGTGNHGVSLVSTEQSQIDGNKIEMEGKNTNMGIYLYNSNYNGITNNNILMGAKFSDFSTGNSPQHSEGISFEKSQWNYAMNNNISCKSAFGTGISLKESSNTNLMENNVSVEGDESGGIRDTDSSDKIFGNNTIVAAGSYAYGIWYAGRQLEESVPAWSEGTSILGNEIRIEGGAGRGIVSSYVKNANISGNNIGVKGKYSRGVDMGYSREGVYEYNNVSVDGDFSGGIDLGAGASENNFTKNYIEVRGDTAFGINMKGYDNTPQNSFIQNAVYAYGLSCAGITSSSAWDIVIDNNLLESHGEGSAGISESECNRCNVTNNNISVSTYEGAADNQNSLGIIKGIWDRQSYAVNIVSNKVILDGGSGFGISSLSGKEINLSGNSVTTKGNLSNGMFVSRMYGIVDNNTIITLGEYSTGIEMQYLEGTAFSNNSVVVEGNWSEGFMGTDVSGINLTENLVEVSANGSTGISLTCERANVFENNISGTGDSNTGFYLVGQVPQQGVALACKGGSENNVSRNNVSLNGNFSTGIHIVNAQEVQPTQTGGSGGSKIMTGGVENENGWDVETVRAKHELVLSGPSCGDGVCDVSEKQTCPQDCGSPAASGSPCTLSTNISRNKISLSGDYVSGLRLYNSNGSIIESNEVSLSGNNSKGIYLSSSINATLKENKFDTKNGYALYIEPSTNKSDYNHTIDETNTEQEKPIYYYFDKKDLEVKDLSDVGQIYIAFSDKPKIENIKSSIDGITIANSNYSTISNCNLTYEGCTVSGIFLIHLDNATINDSTVSSSCQFTPEVSLWNATNVSFINTTYTNAYLYTKNSYLEKLWYFGVNVTTALGLPIEGAQVTGKDTDGKEVFRENTDSQGQIKQKLLMEYNQTGVVGINGGRDYRDPYEFKVTKEGCQDYLQKLGVFKSYILQVVLATSDIF